MIATAATSTTTGTIATTATTTETVTGTGGILQDEKNSKIKYLIKNILTKDQIDYLVTQNLW